METIWLTVSLSINTVKKKRVKLVYPADDLRYTNLFCSLKKAIKDKILEPNCKTDLPEFELVYKADEVNALENDDGTELEDADDLEGMLDSYPKGGGVRIIINVLEDFGGWTEKFLSGLQPSMHSISMSSSLSSRKVIDFLNHQYIPGPAASTVTTEPESDINILSETASPVPRERQRSDDNLVNKEQPNLHSAPIRKPSQQSGKLDEVDDSQSSSMSLSGLLPDTDYPSFSMDKIAKSRLIPDDGSHKEDSFGSENSFVILDPSVDTTNVFDDSSMMSSASKDSAFHTFPDSKDVDVFPNEEMKSNLLKPFDETSEITLSYDSLVTKLESTELMVTDGQPISFKDKEDKSKDKIKNEKKRSGDIIEPSDNKSQKIGDDYNAVNTEKPVKRGKDTARPSNIHDENNLVKTRDEETPGRKIDNSLVEISEDTTKNLSSGIEVQNPAESSDQEPVESKSTIANESKDEAAVDSSKTTDVMDKNKGKLIVALTDKTDNETTKLSTEDYDIANYTPTEEERSILVEKHEERTNVNNTPYRVEGGTSGISHSYSSALMGKSAGNPENRQFTQQKDHSRKTDFYSTQNHRTSRQVAPRTVTITFIAIAKMKGFLAVHYAQGSTYKPNWVRQEFKEVKSWGKNGKLFQCCITVAADVPIYYKLYTYEISSYSSYYPRSACNHEYEDLSHIAFKRDTHGNANRTLITDKDMVLHLAAKFKLYYTSTQDHFIEYIALLNFIVSQSNNIGDIYKHMSSFEIYTLNNPGTDCKKLFQENFKDLIDLFFNKNGFQRMLMLLWILPNFRRNSKSINGLTLAHINLCGSVLLHLTKLEFQSFTKENMLWIIERVSMLISIYKEDCSKFIILFYFLLLKGRDIEGVDVYDPHSPRCELKLGIEFFKECKDQLTEYPALVDMCIGNADLYGLAHLVQSYEEHVSVASVLDCVSKWDLRNVSTMKAKDVKKSSEAIARFVLERFNEKNVTGKLRGILKDFGGMILHRSERYTENNESPVFRLFSQIWTCYILYAVKWNEDIEDVHSTHLNCVDVNWWTKLYKQIEETEPLTNFSEDVVNDKQVKLQAREFLLKKFRDYMTAKSKEEKKKLVETEDFLDSNSYPQKMVNVVIDTLQTFIIEYLKEHKRFYHTNKGFVKALHEILIRKFPNGANHKHLLTADERDTNFFPWEELFDFPEFKENEIVRDAKQTLIDTFQGIKLRTITLALLRRLIDENGLFNVRFRHLITKVYEKTPSEEIKITLYKVADEFKMFQTTIDDCKNLIDFFEKTIVIDGDLQRPKLKDFDEEKIIDIWNARSNKSCVVKQRRCFRNITEEQLEYLQYVKVLHDSKLFSKMLKRNFKEFSQDQFNFDDLLAELVIKALDPTICGLIQIILDIKTESITQEKIRLIFGTGSEYKSFDDVERELGVICKYFEEFVQGRVNDTTLKKIRITRADLNKAFECLDSIKQTLNISKKWNTVEITRKTVCKTEWTAPISAIDSSLELEFFFKIRDTSELVSGFAQSQELINWIKEIAKDESDITTFIDLANTLEDAATSDRLSGLHKIMLAIRPLIFDIKEGDFMDFKQAFEKMYEFVKDDKQITNRLKDVTENLKWFKEMQDLQTDTTKSSISQEENIRSCGVFVVGTKKNRTELPDFFEERKINDLLRADIVFASGETKLWKYRDLKELNDKLVLISGQHAKVLTFTQVFGKLTQICEKFKELNECGHSTYQSWEKTFDFKDPVATLEAVEEQFCQMRDQLKVEEEKIEEMIQRYEPLTNYTRLQLLYLRSKLSQFREAVPHSHYQQTLILLHAINPQITISDVCKAIYKEDIETKMLTLDELGMVLDRVHVKVEGDTSSLRTTLREGSITLLKVNNRDILRCVLSLFRLAGRAPTAEEVLCCSAITNEEQISLFLRRTIFANNFRLINCLVCPENLSYHLNKHFIEQYERLIRNNIHLQQGFFLVVITADNATSEIASTYVQGHRQFYPAHRPEINAFTEQHILKNDACVCDYEQLSGRLLQSQASGNGKTRKAHSLRDEFELNYQFRCIPIHNVDCNRNVIVKEFLSKKEESVKKTMYLVDVSPTVFEGADLFIFELLVLRKITDSSGRVFRPFNGDYILVEGLFTCSDFLNRFPIDFVSFLPFYDCSSPSQSLEIYKTGQNIQVNQIILDDRQFNTEKWQRVYQYLSHFHENNGSMDKFKFCNTNHLTGLDHKRRCIETFLRYVKIEDPSWRELENFVCFLNAQLLCFERSYFTSDINAQELGSSFNSFVVKFMIRMSEEFATRSIKISEGADVLENHKLEKLWDKTFHPYLFFNEDGMCLTFIGFKIEIPGHLVDVVTNAVKEENFMEQDLMGKLRAQRVTFNQTFNDYTPQLLMDKLGAVLDLNMENVQPALDYQLTLDNTVKILAIHMRMRANIPVVIMGETGCGKTRLIAFMSDVIKQSILSRLPEDVRPPDVENLLTLRVHGGVTSKIIGDYIKKAEEQATINIGISDRLQTIVFFDEANATSEIGLIREIMCNHTINGRQINSSLRFIAAVNPYRKHTQAMIEQLKQAGLGYRTNDTADRIGDIPLREVVYRVHPLPPSLKPLIWDFGSMDNNTEKQYIHLIIRSRLTDDSINERFLIALVDIISGCQDILRKRTDQCSFVSLRDVNRFIEVFKWFLKMIPIFTELEAKQAEDEGYGYIGEYPNAVLAAVNAVGVCYFVRINARDEYLDQVAKYFRDPFPTLKGIELHGIIERTQQVLLNELLHNAGVDFADVAENEALRENIFMMVVCIELNIPLFIVGHPGSSKSLAKLIVKACMSGLSSRSPLLEHLCQITMISFQCSPQSEAEGIEKTFRAAEKFISDDTLNKRRRVMPVVVLDEIGLAEDSKKMPLKALHSLLENNGISAHAKIGFIGISNWALDPAKMNRGLYVTRQEPDLDELKLTAWQICKTSHKSEDEDLGQLNSQLDKVAEVYMEIYKEFSQKDSKSYIGLRDFYCLVKHLCRRAEDKEAHVTDGDVLNSVYRNFGGICPDANKKVIKAFERHFKLKRAFIPNTLDMIRENLRAKTLASGSRYLLIVTPTLETTIDVIDQELRKNDTNGRTPQIKFNSDFPDDADYTKRCKIINDVKNSIETGDDLLLIDMEMIYESLYDVLNQYYKEWQGNKYVEIALESNRVNCRVHDNAKIILLARPEQAVKFPIPLLNRLEKHYYTLIESMTGGERKLVRELEEWVNSLTTLTTDTDDQYVFEKNETFIGFHAESVPSMVKTQWKRYQKEKGESKPLSELTKAAPHLLKRCKEQLLRTLSYDGLVRTSMSQIDDYKKIWDGYYDKTGKVWPVVKDMRAFLKYLEKENNSTCTVVTTYSYLPAKKNFPKAEKSEQLIFNVEEFGSQSSFEVAVEPFFLDNTEWLVILVPPGWHKLLSYMRFYLQSQLKDTGPRKHVIIVVQLLRNSKDRPALFHSDVWDNIHIEDLSLSPKPKDCKLISDMSKLFELWFRNIPKLFEDEILSINDILASHKEEVVCNISNPFPHNDVGSMLQECLTSGNLQDRIKFVLKGEQQQGGKLNWVQKSALDKARLSENTSFQKVLLAKVSESLTSAAASIMAAIDRDGNAALRAQPKLTDIWEQMLTILPDSSWTVHDGGSNVMLRKVEHNFLSNVDNLFPFQLQFPFPWLIKKLIDDIATGVYLLFQDVDELDDGFLNELKESDVYKVLTNFYPNEELRQELNERYLSDYVNMVHASKSEIEMQIARRILETSLPRDTFDKHTAEFAVKLHVLHHKKGGNNHLVALAELITVFNQEISKDMECFHAATLSEDPLYTFCEIILNQLESSISNIHKTVSFTAPLTLVMPTFRETERLQLMSMWEDVRFKSLNREFIRKLEKYIPQDVQHTYYVMIEQMVATRPVHECLAFIVEKVNEMIYSTVKDLDLDHEAMDRLWVCAAEEHTVMYDQVVTPCFHVFCSECFERLIKDSTECPICSEPIVFEDMPKIPQELELLVETVEGCCSEAVDFISQVIVTFLSGCDLQRSTLETLSTLGKGRVRENVLLKSVPPEKLESLQTLIFTIFLDNNNYSEFISNICYPVADRLDNQLLAKFITINQDIRRPEIPTLHNTLVCLNDYRRLFDGDLQQYEYINSAIPTVTSLRKLLSDLVDEVLEVLDEGRESEVVTSLCNNLQNFTAPQVYTLKLFFIKQIFRQRGFKVIPELLENPALNWISPVANIQEQNSDIFVLLGRSYVDLRNAFALGDGVNNVEQIEGVLEGCDPLVILAATLYVTMNNTQIPGNIVNIITNKLQDDDADQAVMTCFTACLEGSVCGDKLAPLQQLRSPLTLLFLILQSQCRHPFFRILESIRSHPEHTANKFLPGMRENSLAELVGELGEGGRKYKWYRCANGHAYAINNCGQPAQLGTCHCGAVIGGEDHRFANNHGTELTNAQTLDFQEKGYNLPPSDLRPQTETDTERTLSPLLLNVVRWFVHAAFFLSDTAHLHQQSVFELTENLDVFLINNMQRDLNGMRHHLQVGPDESVMFLVKVMIAISESPQNINYPCSSKQERQNVETSMMATINDLLENSMGAIVNAQFALTNDHDVATDPLIKQLYELEDPASELLCSADGHCSIELWRNSHSLNLDLFSSAFSNNLSSEDQKKYPATHDFLEIRHRMHLSRLLPRIIEFHKRLLSRYSYKISLEEARKTLIKDVIRGDEILEDGFMAWTLAWSELGAESSRFAVPEEYRNKKTISDTEPLSLFLPDLPGPVSREGISCLHLIDGLMSLHNKLAKHSRKSEMKFNSKIKSEVKLSDRFLSIDYDNKRMFMFLLYSHSVQLLGKKREVRFSFDIFERYLTEEVLSGILPISDAMSQFEDDSIKVTYQEDVTWLDLCDKLNQRERQERIPATLKMTFNDIRAATEAKKSLSTAIGYIRAGLGIGLAQESLLDFMTRIGCQGDIVPTRCLKKCHVLDVWYTAYFYKSLQSTHNPFSEIVAPTTLPPEARQWFNDLNQKIVKMWLMEFHRFLVDWTILKPVIGDGAADMTGMALDECYDFYCERALLPRPEDANPTLGQLPDSLMYEHSVAFWLELKGAYHKIQ